ncbi:MAG: hypothetical protein ACRERD_15285 [Candidatus Binatia bacterium]
MFEHIHAGNRLRVPDIEGLLRARKQEGKVMMRVMEHVVRWVNPEPREDVHNQDSNKPLLREDLKPALRQNALRRDHDQTGVYRSSSNELERQVEEDSIAVERLVLTSVRRNMEAFSTPAGQALLDAFPKTAGRRYAERFRDEAWRAVLNAVQGIIFSSGFEPLWEGAAAADPSRVGEKGEDRTVSAITQSLTTLVAKIPEVQQCPELSSRDAACELQEAIDEAITRWVQKRRGRRPKESVLEADEAGVSVVMTGQIPTTSAPVDAERKASIEEMVRGGHAMDGQGGGGIELLHDHDLSAGLRSDAPPVLGWKNTWMVMDEPGPDGRAGTIDGRVTRRIFRESSGQKAQAVGDRARTQLPRSTRVTPSSSSSPAAVRRVEARTGGRTRGPDKGRRPGDPGGGVIGREERRRLRKERRLPRIGTLLESMDTNA